VRPAVQVLDQPEVRLLGALAQEEIRRLDVAVDEPQLVGLPQRATRLGQEMDHATRRLRTSPRQLAADEEGNVEGGEEP